MSGSKCKTRGDIASTAIIFKVLYCRIKNVSLFLCFLMHYLYENYYKTYTVQYYIAFCVDWIPRLTLLDLPASWT